MSKYKFVSMRVSLFCLLITAVLALRTVYADLSVEEDSAVSLDEQANLPLWLQGQSPLPDIQPQTPDYYPVPWSELVAQSYVDNNWEIYRHVSTTTSYRLTNHSASDIQPRLNRGSTRIAFASNRDGDYEIYTMNLDGTGLVQLTNNSTHDGNPSWSPDGTHILFETQRDGQWEVYVMNADGSNQTRLTFDADYDGMPVWSPDGTRIAFVSRRTGGYRIYTMNADGSELVQRSDQPYSFDPTWSPGSDYIVFDADADGDGWQDLWIMAADGTGEYMFYDPYGQTDAWPRAWSQDGRYLAFTNIDFVIQNGVVYWTDAYLRYRDMQTGNVSYLAFYDRAWNPDLQTTDAIVPQSQVNPLPLLSRVTNFGVSWAGSDQISGIAAYDVQYRVGENGTWIDWLTYTGQTSAAFTATPGSTVYFRSRAYDQAANKESWPPEADTFTTFYSWQLSGEVTDNRGIALQGVPISVNPAPMNSPVVTDQNGRYHTLLLYGGTHTIDITYPEYGDFTATPIKAEEISQTYLPPANNVLLNSSFESGTTSWGTGGTIPVTPIYTTYNTGDTAVSSPATCPAPCLTPAELLLDGDAYGSPTTVTDSQGNLHLLFRQASGAYHMIRTVEGDWSTPAQIPGYPVSGATSPLVAIDNDDTLHVVWMEDESTFFPQVNYTQKPLTGTWTTPMVVATNYGVPLDITIDNQGTLHILGSNPGLYYLERRADGTWRTPMQVNEGTNYPDGGGAIAVTSDGAVHVVWQETYSEPSGDHLLLYRQRSPEGIWLAREGMYPSLFHFSTDVKKLLVDTKGTLHLLWGDPYLIHYATRHPVTGWIVAPTEISDAARDIDAVIDSRDTLHLFSLENNDGAYYQYLNPGQPWSSAVLLDTGVPLLLPSISVDDFGVLHLVWEDFWNGFYYYTTETADSPSTGYLQQTVTIPADMLNPTLSFMYKTSPDLPDDDTALVVSATAGITTTQVYTAAPAGNWTLGWVDMQAWAGQTVTVRFAVQQAADDPYLQLFLDSVSLGAAHSDIWVGGTGVTTAEPGDEVVYQLHYGNAGGAGAEDVTVTYTLPAEITFVSASVPPITPTTQALVWELGSLPAGDGPYSITITGTVAANVPYLTELTNTAVITAAAPELRTANNTAVSITFIGRLAYLPVIFE